MPKPFDLAIVNGRVIDGTGAAGIAADVGIEGDTVAIVGRVQADHADQVIDATGLVVAPGFIDIHTHSDITALVDPKAASKLHDGVTTEVAGNCGYSHFPLSDALIERRQQSLDTYGLTIDWRTPAEFIDRYDAAAKLNNRCFLVGQGTVHASVMGYDDRPATYEELERMKAAVAEAMDAGAFGISSGLIYPPGCYTPREELVELCRVAAEKGGFYATHMRSEGDGLEAAVDEAIDVARRAGIPLQISHVKTYGQRNWHKIDWLERRIHDAIGSGLDLFCDRYTYIASATDLGTTVPQWVHEGGMAKTLERLADPASRQRIADEVNAGADPGYWDTIVISSVHSESKRAMEGQSVQQLADAAGKAPVESAMDLLLQEQCRVSIVSFGMCEDNLKRILSWPFVMAGSDASAKSLTGPLAEGKPHPRSFGTFARMLGKYCRDEKVFGLEEAVRRITSLPARRLGLSDRGRLRPGSKADVTVFDPAAVSDRATFAEPHQYSVGIEHVVVNGQVTLSRGELTGAMAGLVLKRVPCPNP